MRRIHVQTLYPLLIITVLAGVWLLTRMNDQHTEQAAESALHRSPFWEPWAAHGVYCQSELDLQNPNVPFTYHIGHPPGDRALVNETVRRLVRTGATPQPWPEASIQRFRILSTSCVDSWEELYSKLTLVNRDRASALLNYKEHPAEEDYRQASLRALYEPMGTADAALEWFPKADEKKNLSQ
jgi:hypothetical protein